MYVNSHVSRKDLGWASLSLKAFQATQSQSRKLVQSSKARSSEKMKRNLRQRLGDEPQSDQPTLVTPLKIKDEPDSDLRATRAARRSIKMTANNNTIEESMDEKTTMAGSDDALNETKTSEVIYVDITKIDDYTTVEGDCLVCQRRFHSRYLAQKTKPLSLGMWLMASF